MDYLIEHPIITAGGIITVMLVLVLGVIYVDCSALGTNTGNQTRFSLLGGGKDSCLVLVKGQWIPTDKWILNTGN